MQRPNNSDGYAPLSVRKEGDELAIEGEGERGVWFSRFHAALEVVPEDEDEDSALEVVPEDEVIVIFNYRDEEKDYG